MGKVLQPWVNREPMDQTPPRLPQPADPPYDAGMEARVAVLEQIAKETRDALVRLDRRFDDVDKRFDEIDKRFDAVDKRFDRVEDNMARLDGRMERFDGRLDRLKDQQSADFRWVVLFAMGALSFIFVTIAHGFRWF